MGVPRLNIKKEIDKENAILKNYQDIRLLLKIVEKIVNKYSDQWDEKLITQEELEQIRDKAILETLEKFSWAKLKREKD